MKKPDAVTVVAEDNFKEKIWGLPVEDLLYVGNSTRRKLNNLAIFTIGDLANCHLDFLVRQLGKWDIPCGTLQTDMTKVPLPEMIVKWR